MISINYQKRKNTELFKCFEESKLLNLSKTQNYIPIYTRFFNLNDTNYNSINLNNKWYISNIESNVEDNNNLFKCRIKNIKTNKVKDRDVFFKMAPLLDPYKYMIGKYDISNTKLFNLPKINSTENECNSKFIDYNNAAYVDGIFLFLSSQLSNTYKFINGVDYYGSFLAIKNDFKLNVFDDIDYLNESDFFNKHKNNLFKIDDYDHLFQKESVKLKPITIGNNISLKSIKSANDDIFEDIFDDNSNSINLNDLKDMSIDLIDLTNEKIQPDHNITLKTSSTCSSRSSYTNDDDTESCENCDPDVSSEKYDEKNIDDYNNSNNNSNNNDINNDIDNNNMNDDINNDNNDINDDDWTDATDDDEIIEVTIPKFPVQVIAMEYCENTFDDLIINQELTTEEWLSAFMQIIMILITYQKAFYFTHNDLHTNNVMYNYTDKKYLYYCYKKKYYKVPTFGRLFKIIDFGRSIFKFDGKLFCSDSFQNGGDAATQYNTEPYFNEKKPRLEPNFSFDLCRLACSIFDYIIDFDEIKDLSKITDPIKRLVFEWCLDDKGINMLYKNNGAERYPEFKLYKMISRCVHYHTPQAQLERPEFDAFTKFNIRDVKNLDEILIDIDKIPSQF